MPKKQLPAWDLSAYYKSISDPKIDLDIKQSQNRADRFANKYRSLINEKISAKTLLNALQEAETIYNDAAKPAIYSHLVHSTDSSNPEIGALMQRTNKAYMDVRNSMLFFDLNLTKLSEPKLKSLISDKVLSNYKNYLNHLLIAKPHRLTEPEEKILTLKSLTSGQAFVRLFDEHMASRKFKMKLGKKVVELSESKVLDYLRDKNRAVRKSASESLTAGLKEDSHLLTYIFNTLAEDKIQGDNLAKFKSPEESRHMGNEINQKIVDTMSAAISENYAIVSDYYKFKKKVLGLSELYDYDRYAPVVSSEARFTFDQAKEIVLRAFRKFSPVIADTAELFFNNNWIDAQPKPGKRGGAYCSYGTNDLHPVVFMNFEGRIDDVSTLAHELGHAVNAYLARKQTPFNFENPLVLAETASVFAELLVFEDLKNLVKSKKDLLSLYMTKIEHTFSTIFRQHAMYKFEQAFHNTRKSQGELSTEQISKMWRESQIAVYGKSVTLTENYNLWWSYIPHFLHTPFYVYAYAFGELLVISLYAKYKKEGESFVPKYLTLMEAGDITRPQELLAPIGINLENKKFWLGGFEVVRALISEAKKLK